MKRKLIHVSLLFIVSVFGSSTLRAEPLKNTIAQLEADIQGRIGISIINTRNGENWHYKGNQRFPMMSTFKALACAKLFRDTAAGTLSLDNEYLIEEKDLIVWSPVTKELVGQSISLKRSCEATMLTSDNTAANIVLDAIGGPKQLTAFLKSIGDSVTRLDRIEPDLNEAKTGDARDTTTPNAMVQTLYNLLLGEVLDEKSSHQITTWMQQNKISGKLLRSVLPKGWSIADRTGSGENGSRGITAMVWKSTTETSVQSPIILAIYVTETDLNHADRNALIAKIGKLLFAELL